MTKPRNPSTRKRAPPGVVDPDPIDPIHFMAVLSWQASFPWHRLADMDTYKLARLLRVIARQAIAEAEANAEIEAEQQTLEMEIAA